MSNFGEFNAENKLRIPLSAYAAQIIENDCFNFSKKKATLINAIIINSYQTADCSISLRLKEYRSELVAYLKNTRQNESNKLIDSIIDVKTQELVKKYAKRYISDVNWQITLQKDVKKLLTDDPYSAEEQYYGQKPGHYVRALLEEYARKPYYSREKIIFKDILDAANIAIDGHYLLNLTNIHGYRYSIKIHSIKTDPLSMFHYIIGINTENDKYTKNNESNIVSLRISRLSTAEPQYLSAGELTEAESLTIMQELETKGVQFVTSETQSIEVWLSDTGIRKYETQAHLRPPVSYRDEFDNHIYHFECTDAQILFYFWGFGKDAKIINPPELFNTFKEKYKEAYESYL